MTDILDTIDASLEEVEEQLLAELAHARSAIPANADCAIDTGIRNALTEIVAELYDLLQNSGDRVMLQLVTERHEVLYARIDVVRQLLSAKIPAGLLDTVHEGLELRRRRLEKRVIRQREIQAEQMQPPKAGLFGGMRGLFDHNPSRQELERNRFSVTQQEAEKLEQHQDYLDNGIYSASRELAMLMSLLRGGSLDTPPDSDPGRGRAVFKARELSTRVPTVNKRARITQERVQSAAQKPAKVEKPAVPETSDNKDIAQTPEEIRRKLETRRDQESAGKATFAAKDVAHAMPQEFYGRKTQAEEDRESAEAEEKEEAKPRTGRAVFESRDLSHVPFPKKN